MSFKVKIFKNLFKYLVLMLCRCVLTGMSWYMTWSTLFFYAHIGKNFGPISRPNMAVISVPRMLKIFLRRWWTWPVVIEELTQFFRHGGQYHGRQKKRQKKSSSDYLEELTDGRMRCWRHNPDPCCGRPANSPTLFLLLYLDIVSLL